MARTITIRFTETRECPNCGGRGDDGSEWRPFVCRRCEGRGELITAVEVEDSKVGVLPPDKYEFTALGEVYLVDYELPEGEELEVIRPE